MIMKINNVEYTEIDSITPITKQNLITMKNKLKITHWAATILLSAMMLMSAGMYLFNNEYVSQEFDKLSFPVYLVYPLAVAKILGVLALLIKRNHDLTKFAYAGFLYDFVLAGAAHIAINDGEQVGAMVAIVLWLVSFITYRKLYNKKHFE